MLTAAALAGKAVLLSWTFTLARMGLMKPPYSLAKFVSSNPGRLYKLPFTLLGNNPAAEFRALFAGSPGNEKLSRLHRRMKKSVSVLLLFLAYLIVALVIFAGQIIPMVAIALIGFAILIYGLMQ